jgi:hypothetical protein
MPYVMRAGSEMPPWVAREALMAGGRGDARRSVRLSGTCRGECRVSMYPPASPSRAPVLCWCCVVVGLLLLSSLSCVVCRPAVGLLLCRLSVCRIVSSSWSSPSRSRGMVDDDGLQSRTQRVAVDGGESTSQRRVRLQSWWWWVVAAAWCCCCCCFSCKRYARRASCVVRRRRAWLLCLSTPLSCVVDLYSTPGFHSVTPVLSLRSATGSGGSGLPRWRQGGELAPSGHAQRIIALPCPARGAGPLVILPRPAAAAPRRASAYVARGGLPWLLSRGMAHLQVPGPGFSRLGSWTSRFAVTAHHSAHFWGLHPQTPSILGAQPPHPPLRVHTDTHDSLRTPYRSLRRRTTCFHAVVTFGPVPGNLYDTAPGP